MSLFRHTNLLSETVTFLLDKETWIKTIPSSFSVFLKTCLVESIGCFDIFFCHFLKIKNNSNLKGFLWDLNSPCRFLIEYESGGEKWWTLTLAMGWFGYEMPPCTGLTFEPNYCYLFFFFAKDHYSWACWLLIFLLRRKEWEGSLDPHLNLAMSASQLYAILP